MSESFVTSRNYSKRRAPLLNGPGNCDNIRPGWYPGGRLGESSAHWEGYLGWENVGVGQCSAHWKGLLGWEDIGVGKCSAHCGGLLGWENVRVGQRSAHCEGLLGWGNVGVGQCSAHWGCYLGEGPAGLPEHPLPGLSWPSTRRCPSRRVQLLLPLSDCKRSS